MRKSIAVLLSIMMIPALAACGSGRNTGNAPGAGDSAGNTAQAAIQETGAAAPEADAAEPVSETSGTGISKTSGEENSVSGPVTGEGRTLVVYYSATGHTEDVAGYIAPATGGDMFRLEPAEPYTAEDLDWTKDDSRVSYEHDHPEARAMEPVAATVDGWDSYDTVFIGYPIWLAYHNLIQCTQA